MNQDSVLYNGSHCLSPATDQSSRKGKSVAFHQHFLTV